MAADTLEAAILNQDDPELVASGVPAYLLLVDGLISQSPDNEPLLSAGAQLFATEQGESRVVAIDPTGAGLPDVPGELVARAPHSWQFEPVARLARSAESQDSRRRGGDEH